MPTIPSRSNAIARCNVRARPGIPAAPDSERLTVEADQAPSVLTLGLAFGATLSGAPF